MHFLLWLNHLIFSPPIIFPQVVVWKHISSKKVFHNLSLENCFCSGFYGHNSHSHDSHLERLISGINIILYPWKLSFTALQIINGDNYYDRKDCFLLLVIILSKHNHYYVMTTISILWGAFLLLKTFEIILTFRTLYLGNW